MGVFFFKGDEMGSVLGVLIIFFLYINKYLVIIKVFVGKKKLYSIYNVYCMYNFLYILM